MNDKTTLQNHLASFKSQIKEVSESLYKFEKDKIKIHILFYLKVNQQRFCAQALNSLAVGNTEANCCTNNSSVR